jgi:hypothetical protein
MPLLFRAASCPFLALVHSAWSSLIIPAACFAMRWASKPENGGGGTKEGTARCVSSTTQDDEGDDDASGEGFTFHIPENSLIAPRLHNE